MIKTLVGLTLRLTARSCCGDIVRRDIGYLPQQREMQKDFPASAKCYPDVLICLDSNLFMVIRSESLPLMLSESLTSRDIKNKKAFASFWRQRQRVLLARAIAGSKKVLVLQDLCRSPGLTCGRCPSVSSARQTKSEGQ